MIMIQVLKDKMSKSLNGNKEKTNKHLKEKNKTVQDLKMEQKQQRKQNCGKQENGKFSNLCRNYRGMLYQKNTGDRRENFRNLRYDRRNRSVNENVSSKEFLT